MKYCTDTKSLCEPDYCICHRESQCTNACYDNHICGSQDVPVPDELRRVYHPDGKIKKKLNLPKTKEIIWI